MPYIEGKSIWEFKTAQDFTPINIDNEIMLTVLIGDKGDKLGRLTKEVCEPDPLYHPKVNTLVAPEATWIWFGGGFKFWSSFEGENIPLEHKKIYLATNPPESCGQMRNPETGLTSIRAGYPEPVIYEDGTAEYTDEILNNCNEMWAETYFEDQFAEVWEPTIYRWEWYVNNCYMQALEDNTTIVCIMPVAGCMWKNNWDLDVVDLKPGDEITTERKGSLCYLMSGGLCEVTIEDKTHTFNKWNCKKLTKDSYTVKNTDSNRIRLMRIYKK